MGVGRRAMMSLQPRRKPTVKPRWWRRRGASQQRRLDRRGRQALHAATAVPPLRRGDCKVLNRG
jgi:hypothetical protein